MRKTTRATAVAAFATSLLLIAGVAFAAGPVLKITSPTSASLLEYSSFPQTLDVTGTVAYTGGSGGNTNLCGVKDLTVTVDDGAGQPDSIVQIGFTDAVASGSAATCADKTSDDWTFPWTINAPGTYTIRATAKVNPSQESGVDTEEILVSEFSLTASFPAAPSVAAKLLADGDVAARYGSGKSGGNHIADVAAEMGRTKGTDFQGVAKSDAAAYRAQVERFLTCKSQSAFPADVGSCPAP